MQPKVVDEIVNLLKERRDECHRRFELLDDREHRRIHGDNWWLLRREFSQKRDMLSFLINEVEKLIGTT